MKTRKVAILLEALTDIPIRDLRTKGALKLTCEGYPIITISIVQVDVNVIKPTK